MSTLPLPPHLPSEMRRVTLISLALIAGTFAGQTAARATTLTYSVYSQWLANVTGSIELNFNAISVNGSYSTSAGKTLQPMSGLALPFVFTGPTISGGYQLTGGDFGPSNAISFYGPSSATGTITVTMPTGGVNALLVGLGQTASGPITVSLSDGEVFTVTANPNTYAFLGFSISHTIDWLTVSSLNRPNLNDFYFATSKLPQDVITPTQTQAPASECATFFLIGGSLLTLFGARRKLFPVFLRM